MTTHYLIDAHTTPIADSQINDVRFNPPGNTSPVNGNFVIRVSDSLDIQPELVTDLNDLLTLKYTEVLAAYPGFSNIIYDDMLDPTGVDTTNSSGVLLGDRGSISLAPSQLTAPPEPLLQMNVVTVGGAPGECVVVWELYSISLDNPRNGRLVRSYTEEDPSDLSAYISWDNGSSWNIVTSGSLLNIPLANQGTQMILQFLVGTAFGFGERRYVGSWAVIY